MCDNNWFLISLDLILKYVRLNLKASRILSYEVASLSNLFESGDTAVLNDTLNSRN